MLSPALQEFLGCDSMPRPQVAIVANTPMQEVPPNGALQL